MYMAVPVCKTTQIRHARKPSRVERTQTHTHASTHVHLKTQTHRIHSPEAEVVDAGPGGVRIAEVALAANVELLEFDAPAGLGGQGADRNGIVVLRARDKREQQQRSHESI